MRGAARRVVAFVAGAVLALSGLSVVDGKPRAQLVTEEVFFVETSECAGASCRKQFIGANETFGMGAHGECSKGQSYGHYVKRECRVVTSARGGQATCPHHLPPCCVPGLYRGL